MNSDTENGEGETVAAANFSAFIGILRAGLSSIALETLSRASLGFAVVAAAMLLLTVELAVVRPKGEPQNA